MHITSYHIWEIMMRHYIFSHTFMFSVLLLLYLIYFMAIVMREEFVWTVAAVRLLVKRVNSRFLNFEHAPYLFEPNWEAENISTLNGQKQLNCLMPKSTKDTVLLLWRRYVCANKTLFSFIFRGKKFQSCFTWQKTRQEGGSNFDATC